jgi:hypothetical protein
MCGAGVANSKHAFAFSRHDLPEVFHFVVPLEEGAGNAGCALHPRSRVQNAQKRNAHEHTGSAEAVRHSLRSGFTAYAALSPATNSSCHRRCRLEAETIRLDQIRHRQLGTSNGCRDHTVLPYANSIVRLARCCSLTAEPPREQTCRADALASTASRLAFVTIAIRPSCRDETARE